MFEQLNLLPSDPILGLMTLYREDSNPRKVDLGVGVYKTEDGQTPVMSAIKAAESALVAAQTSKVYVGPAGNLEFLQAMGELLLGESQAPLKPRLAWAQTPGGCGALRVAAELVKTAKPDACIWVSDPTWGNHIPLLGNAGLRIKTYPYFNPQTNALAEDALLESLGRVPAGDLVLLHGCCHNPTGVDLAPRHWQAIADSAQRQGFVPFVDMAYQGFGEDLTSDAYGLRLLMAQLPEVLLAVSCSKNFGLYRERVGALAVLNNNATAAQATNSHLLSIVRGIYSMPPDHGAALVAAVWQHPEWRRQWLDELAQMRGRILQLRRDFVAGMQARGFADRFNFIAGQKGMFSFLGLTPAQVQQLIHGYSIYLLGNSRASIAGLNRANLDAVCDAVAAVVRA
jgi:aspartate aminotransferase